MGAGSCEIVKLREVEHAMSKGRCVTHLVRKLLLFCSSVDFILLLFGLPSHW